jgi:hypothetical protein
LPGTLTGTGHFQTAGRTGAREHGCAPAEEDAMSVGTILLIILIIALLGGFSGIGGGPFSGTGYYGGGGLGLVLVIVLILVLLGRI